MKSFIFVFLVCFAVSAQAGIIDNMINYKSDYTVPEILRLFVSGVKLTYGRLLNGNDAYGPIDQEVTFWCINRDTNKVQQTHINDTDVASKINPAKPLWTVTHGWIDNVNRTWVQTLLKEIIVYYDVNACGVDWNRLANYEYSISATKNVPMVGDYLAQFITATGIPLDQVTMVGHSLGGQICGQAGMQLKGLVARIFGLDPAGPLFCFPTENPITKRLDSSDAKFVQVIHTTDRMLGCQLDCGHQDFRADGGTVPQRACYLPVVGDTLSPEIVSCSHSHSIQEFTYSLNPSNNFVGTQCGSYTTYNMMLCNGHQTDLMGPRTAGIYGRYYLKTKFSAPFI